jgi:hypothetical protein
MTSSRLHVPQISAEDTSPRNAPIPRKPRRKVDPDLKMVKAHIRFLHSAVVPYAESIGIDAAEFVEPLNEQLMVMLERSKVVAEEQRRFAHSLIGPIE